MANNDDYDPWDPQTYAPGQAAPPPQPQYPTEPGTTSALGMGAQDPLRDWAKQLTPDQLQTFSAHHAMGDPESAKQSLIDAGVPPPDHHYDSQGRPFYPTDAFGTTQISSGGEISQTPQQQVSQAVRGAQQPQAPSLGVSSELSPEETGTNPIVEKAKRNYERAQQAQPPPPQTKPLIETPPPPPPAAPPSSAGAPAQPNWLTEIWNRGFGTPSQREQPPAPTPPKAEAPAPAPEPEQPKPPSRAKITNPDGSSTTYTAPKEQVPLPRERPAIPREKSMMERTGEGLSELSKSLEGVKAPPRAPFPQIGAVAPRGPVGLHPQIQHLLSLVGQNPAAAQGLIQRIAGVGRF